MSSCVEPNYKLKQWRKRATLPAFPPCSRPGCSLLLRCSRVPVRTHEESACPLCRCPPARLGSLFRLAISGGRRDPHGARPRETKRFCLSASCSVRAAAVLLQHCRFSAVLLCLFVPSFGSAWTLAFVFRNWLAHSRSVLTVDTRYFAYCSRTTFLHSMYAGAVATVARCHAAHLGTPVRVTKYAHINTGTGTSLGLGLGNTGRVPCLTLPGLDLACLSLVTQPNINATPS